MCFSCTGRTPFTDHVQWWLLYRHAQTPFNICKSLQLAIESSRTAQASTEAPSTSKASNHSGKQNGKTKGKGGKAGKGKSSADPQQGASTVSSGVKLEDVRVNFPHNNSCSEWQAPLLNSTQVLLIDGEVRRMLQQHSDYLGVELNLDDACRYT